MNGKLSMKIEQNEPIQIGPDILIFFKDIVTTGRNGGKKVIQIKIEAPKSLTILRGKNVNTEQNSSSSRIETTTRDSTASINGRQQSIKIRKKRTYTE